MKKIVTSLCTAFVLLACSSRCSAAAAQKDYNLIRAFHEQELARYDRERESARQKLASQPTVRGDIQLIQIVLSPITLGPLKEIDYLRAYNAQKRMWANIYSGEPEAIAWSKENIEMLTNCKNICGRQLWPQRFPPPPPPLRKKTVSMICHVDSSTQGFTSLEQTQRSAPSPNQLQVPLSRVGSCVSSRNCSQVSSRAASFRDIK